MDDTISTKIPSGMAKIVFHTDSYGSGIDFGYDGLIITYNVDSSFVGVAHENLYVGEESFVNGNSIIRGKLGVGTLNPLKKAEIHDGSASFSFSAINCTDEVEVAQTIDNNGYKIEVAGASMNYLVAAYGQTKFKLLLEDNYALGAHSLSNLSSGAYHNVGIGNESLFSNITGTYNQGFGYGSLYSSTTGSYNNSFGQNALYGNTTGSYNTALGNGALQNNTTGSYNIGIGQNAGKFITGGSTANTISTNSIFIGRGTKAKANNETNQIVIGFNAVGNGSNTITLGNSDITKTILNGKVGIDKIYPDYKLDVSGSIGLENDLLITSSRLNFGGAVNIINTNKTGTGKASKWAIFNTSGSNGNALQFWSYSNNTGPDFNGGINRFTITDDGKVGIGTNIPDEKLTVNGIIHAKEIKIDLTGPLADFVFKPSYRLMPLHEVEMFVQTNNHLPGIPSATEVQANGLNIGEMQNKLLQKIEELTLYVIEQGKTIERQHKEIEDLKLRMEQ